MAVRDPLEAAAARHHVTDALPEALARAERLLGHTFAQPALLTEALTHRSAAHGKRSPHKRGERRGVGSNERLEFVGDRVLGLLIAEWLVERFPAEQEGELARRQAHLVSREVLAAIADHAELSRVLALAPNEARSGVGALMNVLADAMEAALGAVYLDGGLEPARRFVRAAWLGAMEQQIVPPKDPKTGLQEWLMARGLPLPIYVEEGRSGPSHAPEFIVTVTASGQTGRGAAGNKRLAEREAAAALLERLKV